MACAVGPAMAQPSNDAATGLAETASVLFFSMLAKSFSNARNARRGQTSVNGMRTRSSLTSLTVRKDHQHECKKMYLFVHKMTTARSPTPHITSHATQRTPAQPNPFKSFSSSPLQSPNPSTPAGMHMSVIDVILGDPAKSLAISYTFHDSFAQPCK